MVSFSTEWEQVVGLCGRGGESWGFCKNQEISQLTKHLLAFQLGLCTRESVVKQKFDPLPHTV
jgi:hypothetical protein